jgi:uncharacterized membrane protein YjgN (DUF898 family)
MTNCPACGRPLSTASAQCACGATPLAETTPESSTPPSAVKLQAAFHGDGAELFGIFLKNVLLTLVTLGVYYFWAKVEIRRYLYSQAEFAGERFAYHATGKELFFSWLKALCIFTPIGAIAIAIRVYLPGPTGQLVSTLSTYLIVACLIPIVMVASWRFRLSRTSWCGIRFSFRGRTSEFLGKFLLGSLFTILTLGLYYPFFHVKNRRYFARNTYFGNVAFDFVGSGSEMLGRALLAGVLWPFTLGLSFVWFAAWRERFHWGNTIVQGNHFRSEVTGLDFLWLKLSNSVLLIITLGIAFPWVLIRTRRFHLSQLSLEGTLNLEAIRQEVQTASALGEELGDLVDIGVLDLDLGF